MNASEWNQRSNADPNGLSLLAADVAKLTLDVGHPVIAEVDAFANDLARTLTGCPGCWTAGNMC